MTFVTASTRLALLLIRAQGLASLSARAWKRAKKALKIELRDQLADGLITQAEFDACVSGAPACFRGFA
jgi:hypothetical protein